jgi:hypothetical protein
LGVAKVSGHILQRLVLTLTDGLADAKIEHLGELGLPSRHDKDVVGLEIAMHDLHRVGIGEGPKDL